MCIHTASLLAACRWGLDIAKSWLFASSTSLVACLAGKCEHPRDAHASIAGVLDEFGGFSSQQTAVYLASLCQAYAAACSSLLSSQHPCTTPLFLATAQAGILPKPKIGPPTATQDGGGIASVPDWSVPPLGVHDCMQSLRTKLHAWLLESRVPCRFNALLQGHELSGLFSSEEVAHARSLFSAWLVEQGHSGHVSWDIPSGQPYALHALAALSSCLKDRDSALFPALLAGVPTGFDSDIPASGCLLSAPPSEHAFALDLAICQGNWQGAESDPASLQELIQAEENAGFVREFPSLEAAQAHFGSDRVAVGRVNIVHAPGKKPRLVVDSSVCHTNQACRVPEKSCLPSLGDIRSAFPLREDIEEVFCLFCGYSCRPQNGQNSRERSGPLRFPPARAAAVLPGSPVWSSLLQPLVRQGGRLLCQSPPSACPSRTRSHALLG